ncbi:hypothetical protein Leryth_002514 [Lithospermum erythrorhizon]|nr:hypothetical protein Leryth_002514 [Lithospermum erythrorhizon]
MYKIKHFAWKLQSLCAHHSRYCRYSPLEGKLNLGCMFIFGSE